MATWESSLEKSICDYLTYSKHLKSEIYSHCKNFKTSDIDNALKNLMHSKKIVFELNTGYFRII